MAVRLLSLLMVALLGCAGRENVAPAVSASAGAADPVLGTLDGISITQSQLPPEVRERLLEQRNETAQRELHLLWIGFEDAIGDALLKKEATRRGISVDALREAEITAKVMPPSDEEVKAFYEDNAQGVGVAFEDARGMIKSELLRERTLEQERAYLETLRQGADVKYTLPMPELPRVTMESAGGAELGPKNAKITALVFSDFQCPYCARARRVFERLHTLYPNDLRIVFKDFPLAQHPDARRAAEAAQCAREQDKFWPYHDKLFDNQSALGDDDLKRYAQEVGLSLEGFASCLASGRAQTAVRSGEADGRKMGVNGTPAIYINGMKLVGLLPLPLLQSLIDRELAR